MDSRNGEIHERSLRNLCVFGPVARNLVQKFERISVWKLVVYSAVSECFRSRSVISSLTLTRVHRYWPIVQIGEWMCNAIGGRLNVARVARDSAKRSKTIESMFLTDPSLVLPVSKGPRARGKIKWIRDLVPELRPFLHYGNAQLLTFTASPRNGHLRSCREPAESTVTRTFPIFQKFHVFLGFLGSLAHVDEALNIQLFSGFKSTERAHRTIDTARDLSVLSGESFVREPACLLG